MANEIESISQGNYILHNIDAKKLYVQEPLFTANSGDAVYVGWRPDETVLWSGDAAVSNCTLTEPITNFNTVKFLLYGREDANRTRMWFECETTNDTWNIQYADGTNYAYTQLVQLSSTNTTLSAIRYKELNYGAYNSTAVSITGATGTYPAIIKAVVGCNRKENA